MLWSILVIVLSAVIVGQGILVRILTNRIDEQADQIVYLVDDQKNVLMIAAEALGREAQLTREQDRHLSTIEMLLKHTEKEDIYGQEA